MSKKLTIDEMHIIAKEREGKCISNTYVNTKTKLIWECAKGHQWEAQPSNIKSGKWCPYCIGKYQTIEQMRQIADGRGGKCLSDTYLNAKTKLLWECAEGHQWEAQPSNIKKGQWCPECSSGIGERICKDYFEQLFGSPFPKSHPKWLVNDRGNQMELDGYCKKLKLAFEHQGEQHFTTNTHFLTSIEDLRQRQKDDQLKIELCKDNGINLIIVPEIPNRLPLEKIKSLIKDQCKLHNIRLPKNFDSKQIDLKKAYSFSSKELLKELSLIAQTQGGKCLSKNYLGIKSKLLWECKHGHQWKAKPDNIKTGKWCPECAIMMKGNSQRSNIENMRRIAEEHGGKCLSDTYTNTKTKLLWECAEGHQWKAIQNNVKKGHWCPVCANKIKGNTQRSNIENMQRIAEERGGKCLSDVYINTHTKLLWECAEKHKWEAQPSNIKSGKWCPYCAGKGV